MAKPNSSTLELIMRAVRRLSSINAISYSFTDEQVVNSVRAALITGILVGSLVTGFLIQMFH